MADLSDRIANIIAWYEENRGAIAQALPLTHQGTTWTTQALASQDESIRQYRAGELRGHLKNAYIWQSLCRLYRAVEHSKKED